MAGRFTSYEKSLMRTLKDRAISRHYFAASVESGDVEGVVFVMRDIIRANGLRRALAILGGKWNAHRRHG